MKVAIIGTGKMGVGLARLLGGHGVNIIIGSRDAAKAAKLAEEIGRGAQGSGIADAARLASVVILAVNYKKVEETIGAAGDLAGKILSKSQSDHR